MELEHCRDINELPCRAHWVWSAIPANRKIAKNVGLVVLRIQHTPLNARCRPAVPELGCCQKRGIRYSPALLLVKGIFITFWQPEDDDRSQSPISIIYGGIRRTWHVWSLPGRPQARRSLPCNQSAVNVVPPARFYASPTSCISWEVETSSKISAASRLDIGNSLLWQASDCRFKNDDGLKARFSTARIHKVIVDMNEI